MKHFLLFFLIGISFLAQTTSSQAVVQSFGAATRNDFFVSDSFKKTEPKQNQLEKKQIEQETKQDPNAGYGYAKKYASKRFKIYSGYITIEQKNIPAKITVAQESTIQINLQENPDSFWIIELNEKVGKIVKNELNGNQRTLIIQAIAKGNTRLILDCLSKKDNKFKVIFSKRMNLSVVEP